MKLSIDSDDGNTVNMKIAGSVTQQEIELLADPVSDLLGPEAYRRRVCIDLGNAGFLDSSGINWLILHHRALSQTRGPARTALLAAAGDERDQILKMQKVFDVTITASGSGPRRIAISASRRREQVVSTLKLGPFPTGAIAELEPAQALEVIVTTHWSRATSDLFMLSDEDDAKLAVRRLGVVQTLASVPKEQGRQLLNYMKAMAGIDMTEHRKPTEGRLIYETLNRHVDLRLNFIPTMFGEDMTARLLDREFGFSHRSINSDLPAMRLRVCLQSSTAPVG